jgi:regulator of protease activity HflC (stomatin/prohibitin superfamily)
MTINLNERRGKTPRVPGSGGGVVRTIAFAGIGGLLLLMTTCTLAQHSTTVQPGEVGVLIRTLGANAGVEPNSLPPGWHFVGIGERIVQFPSIERSYAYTRERNADGNENEEISFSDHTGLPMTADVQIVLRVDPRQAPRLYQTWRLSFDQLFETPIRNDVRLAIAAETELLPVDQLYSGGRQGVIQRALARVQRRWAPQGVIISQIEWLGNIRYPESVVQGIQARTVVEQQTLAAQGRVAQAQAEADARIAQARGEAEATRLQAEAIRSNPEVLRQQEINRWRGLCPLNVRVCIIGSNAQQLIEDNGAGGPDTATSTQH